MESLALMVCIIFGAVMCSGPVAVLLAYYRLNVLAILAAGIALWLGLHWCITVSTSARYLGLISAALGLWAFTKAAGAIFK